MITLRNLFCRFGMHDWRCFDAGEANQNVIRICAICRKRERVLDTGYWDLDICDTQWCYDRREETPCLVPPAGWFCSREGGHDGPCAAYPV